MEVVDELERVGQQSPEEFDGLLGVHSWVEQESLTLVCGDGQANFSKFELPYSIGYLVLHQIPMDLVEMPKG